MCVLFITIKSVLSKGFLFLVSLVTKHGKSQNLGIIIATFPTLPRRQLLQRKTNMSSGGGNQPQPQYQRAVTPTMELAGMGNSSLRGKILNGGGVVGRGRMVAQGGSGSGQTVQQLLLHNKNVSAQQRGGSGGEINIQGRSAVGGVNSRGVLSQGLGALHIGGGISSGQAGDTVVTSAGSGSASAGGGASSGKPKAFDSLFFAGGSTPKYDILPLTDEVPPDGIMFARVRNQPEILIVFRTPDERVRNPERLNLDRRQLESCPVLEHEQRLRLINYQNNNITAIKNLENLPNLIFLDMYNNKLASLDGSLSCARGLRVLMAGKNRLGAISNLTLLKKLDVLDLHSNEIKKISGLETLVDLRVLNLAGNLLTVVEGLSSLSSLTELNLRRNNIKVVNELDKITSLQRIFLSHNQIARMEDIHSVFNVKYLIELSLDGNPITEYDPQMYRAVVVDKLLGLRHLDLKRITEEERNDLKKRLSEPRVIQYILSSDVTTSEVKVSAIGTANSKDAPSEIGIGGGAGSLTAVGKSTIHQWTNLARHGRLGSTHGHMFEIEPLGADEREKSLVIVGDAWEWPLQMRRSLSAVTEVSILYVRFDMVLTKFFSNVSLLPALKVLRLRYNEMTTLREIRQIAELLLPLGVEHLIIQDNPISKFTLLDGFVSVLVPKLKFFNNVSIFTEERNVAKDKLKHFIKLPQIEASGSDHCATANGLANFSPAQCSGVQAARRAMCWAAFVVDMDEDREEKMKAADRQVQFWDGCYRQGHKLSTELEVGSIARQEACLELDKVFTKMVETVIHEGIDALQEFALPPPPN